MTKVATGCDRLVDLRRMTIDDVCAIRCGQSNLIAGLVELDPVVLLDRLFANGNSAFHQVQKTERSVGAGSVTLPPACKSLASIVAPVSDCIAPAVSPNCPATT